MSTPNLNEVFQSNVNVKDTGRYYKGEAQKRFMMEEVENKIEVIIMIIEGNFFIFSPSFIHILSKSTHKF